MEFGVYVIIRPPGPDRNFGKKGGMVFVVVFRGSVDVFLSMDTHVPCTFGRRSSDIW